MTVEECLSNILKRNPNLISYKGSFYRYDTGIWKYRIMNTSAFTNDIFQMTKRTASRKFIDQVLDGLRGIIRKSLPVHTPEAKFIEEHLAEGGKAILEDIRKEYQVWCGRNGFVPTCRSQKGSGIQNGSRSETHQSRRQNILWFQWHISKTMILLDAG